MKRYEAMFLFDNAAARDWASVEQEIKRLCGRIGAELEVCIKYDERKLAFEIANRKRGTYVLAYLKAPPDKITDLERDVRLSEVVLRVLVTRPNNVTDEKIAELRALPADQPLSPLAHEVRRGEYDGGYGGRGGGRRDFDRGGDRHDESGAAVRAIAAELGDDLGDDHLK